MCVLIFECRRITSYTGRQRKTPQAAECPGGYSNRAGSLSAACMERLPVRGQLSYAANRKRLAASGLRGAFNFHIRYAEGTGPAEDDETRKKHGRKKR